MRHIKLFENFDQSTGSLEIAKQIARKVFGTWEKGEYSDNDNYAYGQEYKFKDGTREKGYVTNTMTLQLSAPSIATKFMNKAALTELLTLVPKDKLDKLYSLNSVCVRVSKHRMITSKRVETVVSINLGGRMGGNFYRVTNRIILDDESKNTIAADLLKEVKELSAEVTGKDLIKVMFEDLAWSKVLPVTKEQKDGGKARHVGIGSQASTKVHHDIKMGYDISKYLKKYGESAFKSAMAGTYFSKRYFRGIEKGVLLTDESWTDTYD